MKTLHKLTLALGSMSLGAATAIFWCGALFVDSAEPNLNTVYISEFMAVNGGAFPDREGEYVDWLELHNPTEETVTLAGGYLRDA